MKSIGELLKEKTGIESVSSEEIQNMQVQWYNESEGYLNKEDEIECSECLNKGWKQYIRDNQVMMSECSCMKKRKLVRKAKNSGLGEYLHKRSKDYIVEMEWQKQNKEKMVEFCQKHSEDNVWFLALGTSGSGKTLMCSIIANHLLLNLGRTVMYVTWTDFVSRLKRDMMGSNTNSVSEYLEDIKNVEVLFLDELIKKYNETDLKYLIEIINYRYTNNLKTLITSERIIDELLDVDEATFGRAVEKCEGYLINIPKDRSKNYRLRNINV